MAKVHAYLNFSGNCAEAFKFYEKVFKTQSVSVSRYGDMPSEPGQPELPAGKGDLVAHTALPINDTTMLMGSDIIEEFTELPTEGTRSYIMLDTSTPEEAKELYDALKENAKDLEMELGKTFFADQFASLKDQFGVCWMIIYEGSPKVQ